MRQPPKFGELLAFVYTPKLWARKYGLAWTERLERKRRLVQTWLYHLARVPLVGPDGRRTIPPIKLSKPRYSPLAPAARAEWLDLRMAHGDEEQIEADGFTVVRNPREAYLREEGDPPEVVEALRGIEQQAGEAYFQTWRVCPLCARVFPVSRDAPNAKTCAPCRRRFKHRRQIQRRLRRAPKVPVEYYYLDASSKLQLTFLYINPNVMRVRAPLRRGLDLRPAGYVFGPNESDTK